MTNKIMPHATWTKKGYTQIKWASQQNTQYSLKNWAGTILRFIWPPRLCIWWIKAWNHSTEYWVLSAECCACCVCCVLRVSINKKWCSCQWVSFGLDIRCKFKQSLHHGVIYAHRLSADESEGLFLKTDINNTTIITHCMVTAAIILLWNSENEDSPP